MGILRLILLFVLGALLYRLWTRWRLQQAARRTPGRRNQGRDEGRMLACAHCGMYIPEQNAVRDDGQVFCSTAHRDAHRKT